VTTHPRIPRRASLVAQTAEILRDDIHNGVWREWLPGELELCRQFQVSRVTLRAALAKLQHEGLLQAVQGRRRRVLVPARRAAALTNRIVFLSPAPLHALPQFIVFLIDELREHLAAAGWHLDFQTIRPPHTRRLDASLDALVQRLRPAACVLYRSTRPVQEWFSRHGLPAVISGSRHEGVNLTAVDVDYRAGCFHAAGLFQARGHRHLALLNPRAALAGDRESEDGFRDGARRGSRVTIAHHDGNPADVCAKLDELLALADPPTALLVSSAQHVLTVLGHLAQRNRQLPRDLALISRDDEPYLAHVIPTVARYSTDSDLFARKLCRVVLDLAGNRLPRPREHRLIPRFIPGDTLG
jgi:DNA-binding LacI/PurR family transcriptional regulator